MTELVEFLRAQLTENKQRVLSAGPAKLGWGTYLRPDGGMGYTSPVASVHGDDAEWVTAGKVTCPDLVTVVFDPVDVLADIDAKLRLVDALVAREHHGTDRDWYGCRARTEDPHTDYDMPSGNACTCGRDEEVEHALRLLALPFAGHDDYRKEWAVD